MRRPTWRKGEYTHRTIDGQCRKDRTLALTKLNGSVSETQSRKSGHFEDEQEILAVCQLSREAYKTSGRAQEGETLGPRVLFAPCQDDNNSKSDGNDEQQHSLA